MHVQQLTYLFRTAMYNYKIIEPSLIAAILSINTVLFYVGQSTLDEDYFNESALIRKVEISQIDQYVRLLLEESRAHELEGSEYFTMNDFENSQGYHFFNYNPN